MKKILFLLLFSLVALCDTMAQRYVITGQTVDSKTKNPLESVTVLLQRGDSTKLKAIASDGNGMFTLETPGAGEYTVRCSLLGAKTLYKTVKLTAENDSVGLGTLPIVTNEKVLGTATVTAVAARVEQKDDTTMFNAAAYRVPTGSTLEALVKQLPGVEVSDDGTIKWNGKTVSEFLINGKDFFKGDTKTAMKNLPTEMVSKIKAYDKKSDYAEQTGIDDGEETTVLDIATKRELNESWITNIDVGYGNHDRYTGRVFATRFTDRSRVSAFGSANNTNDQGFGGPRGFGGGGGGLVATKNAGIDFSWENGKKKREAGRFEAGGNVRYSHTGSDAISKSNSEMFLTTGSNSSFSNSYSKSASHSTSVNSSFRLQWQPDSMTNISFRPSYSYTESNSDGNSRTATFNDDPFTAVSANPLDSIFAETAKTAYPELYAMMVNTQNRISLSDNKSHNVNGELNVIRRFGNKGRNLSLQAGAGYSKSESHSYSISDIRYSSVTPSNTKNFLNQYSTSPSKNYNYSVRLGYVEPIAKNLYAELRYQYSYKYQDGNRSRYNLDSLANKFGLSQYPLISENDVLFGDEDNYPSIGTLPTVDEVLNYVRDLNNSQYATYKYYDHTANIGIRYNTDLIRFNAGVDFNPEKTKMAYNRPGQNIDTLITRNVFNVSPQVRLRFKFSKTHQLEFFYRGSSSQPSMTDLLAVVDDSNPLSISMGNPGLKPSWNNNFRVNFNGYNPTRQQGIMFGFDGKLTKNSISNRMVYDPTTGISLLRPDNINGNWNGRGMFMFNTALGPQKLFNISTFTSISYDNSVGYVSTHSNNNTKSSVTTTSSYLVPLDDDVTETKKEEEISSYDYYESIFNQAESQKNTTKTLGVSENLNLSYRNSWYDIGILGNVNYQHARATVQENANMDTWNFAYGANANLNFDFGLSISTDIRMSSRRGYSDASMNTNELLWNAQIAQSFLKNRAATISIQFYDILQNKSNISRTLSATRRTDSWSNAINSYFMVHFIYKLNIFAGSSKSGDNQKGERQGPPDMRGLGGLPLRGRMGGPGGGPGGRM